MTCPNCARLAGEVETLKKMCPYGELQRQAEARTEKAEADYNAACMEGFARAAEGVDPKHNIPAEERAAFWEARAGAEAKDAYDLHAKLLRKEADVIEAEFESRALREAMEKKDEALRELGQHFWTSCEEMADHGEPDPEDLRLYNLCKAALSPAAPVSEDKP